MTSVANPDDVADVPTNDPALGLRGPGSSGSGTENSIAASSAGPIGASTFQPSSGPVSGSSVDVGINAVIVSGARTPWEAIGKGPGVQNVIVTAESSPSVRQRLRSLPRVSRSVPQIILPDGSNSNLTCVT